MKMSAAPSLALAVLSVAVGQALFAAPVTWNREELFAVPKSWPAESVVTVRFDQDDRLPVKSASLDFTADDCRWWYSNRWESVSAELSGGRASAAVPSAAKWAYLSVTTTNDAVISSAVLDLRK